MKTKKEQLQHSTAMLNRDLESGCTIYFVHHTDTTVSVFVPLESDERGRYIEDITFHVATVCGYRMRKRGFSLPSGYNFSKVQDVVQTLTLRMDRPIRFEKLV